MLADSSDRAVGEKEKTSSMLYFSIRHITYLCVSRSGSRRGLSTAQREERGGRRCGVMYVTSHVSTKCSFVTVKETTFSQTARWFTPLVGSGEAKVRRYPLIPHKPRRAFLL